MDSLTVNGDRMGRTKQAGFTYLAALFLIVVMGVMLAGIGKMWSTARQQEREQELLFVGNQFRQAIGQYYQHSPGGVKVFPQQIEDLLLDKRQMGVQRYLRKIYRDPMTMQAEWAVVMQNDRLIGVYSMSQETPLKSGNFSQADKEFEGSENYGDWKFVYTPK